MAAAYVESNALAIAFISASLFLVYVTSTCAWALSSVAVPTNCTASIGAVQNFGGYLGGALAPTVTGLIVQTTGSFVPALVVGALIGVVSAASYFFIVDQPITAMDMDAISDPGAAVLKAGATHRRFPEQFPLQWLHPSRRPQERAPQDDAPGPAALARRTMLGEQRINSNEPTTLMAADIGGRRGNGLLTPFS